LLLVVGVVDNEAVAAAELEDLEQGQHFLLILELHIQLQLALVELVA
jgi:hypothetical protein